MWVCAYLDQRIYVGIMIPFRRERERALHRRFDIFLLFRHVNPIEMQRFLVILHDIYNPRVPSPRPAKPPLSIGQAKVAEDEMVGWTLMTSTLAVSLMV